MPMEGRELEKMKKRTKKFIRELEKRGQTPKKKSRKRGGKGGSR